MMIFFDIMKFLSICVLGLFVIGCANSSDPLIVKTHTIRDQETITGDDVMVHHEKIRRLYGAISMEERAQRLGQYYTVLWKAEAGADKEILFEYQQAKSGSEVKQMRRVLDAGSASGKVEFSIIGDNYYENGRVLTWKISLISGGEVIATEQSYLWE